MAANSRVTYFCYWSQWKCAPTFWEYNERTTYICVDYIQFFPLLSRSLVLFESGLRTTEVGSSCYRDINQSKVKHKDHLNIFIFKLKFHYESRILHNVWQRFLHSFWLVTRTNFVTIWKPLFNITFPNYEYFWRFCLL